MADFTTPWNLKTPAANPIGDKVQVRQIHLGLFPKPYLAIGYNVGQVTPEGIVAGKTHTRVITRDDLEALNPAAAAARVAGLRNLVDLAYTLLNEAQHITEGTRV